MGNNNEGFVKYEGLLRLLAFLCLVLAGILVSTDSQTKVFFDVVKKKARFKLATIFIMSVYVHFICAGYGLGQLLRCFFFNQHHEDELSSMSHYLKWIYFLLDQMTAYLVFATNCAQAEFSIIAIFGAESMQWMKLCNKYTRFCYQIGSSIVFGIFASILLAFISAISTFNLFRCYSPNFLGRKPIKVGVSDSS